MLRKTMVQARPPGSTIISLLINNSIFMSAVNVTKENFRWIIIEVVIQVLLYFFINLSNGAMRGKYFPTTFMETNFGEAFKNAGKTLPVGGVPDCGNGKFADKLTFDNWVSYNLMHHTANNAIHSIVGTVLITLGLGVYLPSTGIVVGAILIAWRIVYTIVGRQNASSLASLDPVNHGLHLFGLASVSIVALYTAAN